MKLKVIPLTQAHAYKFHIAYILSPLYIYPAQTLFFFHIYSVMFHRQHLPLVLLQKTMDVLQYVLIILYLYFKYDNISDYMSFQYLFLLL